LWYLNAEYSLYYLTPGAGFFFSTTTSRLALGAIQPPTQWVPDGWGSLFPGSKGSKCEAGHSILFITEGKNMWNSTSTLLYIFMA